MPVAILIILAAGVVLAIQPPTNAALAHASGSVLLASLTSFVIGGIALAATWLAIDRTPVSSLRGAPAWAWLGGIYGACYVAAMAYATPRLGIATTLAVAIASQLAAALILDHFGLLGLKVAPISLGRVAGIALIVGGVVLVRRS